MHLVPPTPSPPQKIWITFVFLFSWVLQPSQEKLKKMIGQNVGGVGANRVYYGRRANGELIWKWFLFFYN